MKKHVTSGARSASGSSRPTRTRRARSSLADRNKLSGRDDVRDRLALALRRLRAHPAPHVKLIGAKLSTYLRTYALDTLAPELLEELARILEGA